MSSKSSSSDETAAIYIDNVQVTGKTPIPESVKPSIVVITVVFAFLVLIRRKEMIGS